MFKSLGFLFCLLMISPNVLAQERNWDKISGEEEFHTCYDSAAVTKLDEECNYTKNCINSSPNNSTTIGMVKCAAKGYNLWDEKLNLEYKKLTSLVEQIYGENARIALRDSQRAWIKYRDINCEAVYQRQDLKRGASKIVCFTRLTSSRTIEFKSDNLFYIGRGYKVSE